MLQPFMNKNKTVKLQLDQLQSYPHSAKLTLQYSIVSQCKNQGYILKVDQTRMVCLSCKSYRMVRISKPYNHL